MEKLKAEYLDLCLTFGTIEVDSIISFEQYKEYRNLSVRQSRAATELKAKSNGYEIGSFIMEQILIQGIEQLEQELKEGKLDRSIIAPGLYQETIEILKKHIQLN